MEQTNTPKLNPQAASIVKALAYTENGGQPDVKNLKAGGSGETKSVFQFMPDTWKMYAKQVLGNDNAPMTPENESVVVYQKVNNWLNQGYDVNQIASMWNAGEQRPDAYKQNVKGINKKGVSYDTPAYAKKVSDYAKKFGEKSAVTTSQTEPSTIAMSQPADATTTPPTIKELRQQGSAKQPKSGLMKQPRLG